MSTSIPQQSVFLSEHCWLTETHRVTQSHVAFSWCLATEALLCGCRLFAQTDVCNANPLDGLLVCDWEGSSCRMMPQTHLVYSLWARFEPAGICICSPHSMCQKVKIGYMFTLMSVHQKACSWLLFCGDFAEWQRFSQFFFKFCTPALHPHCFSEGEKDCF